jgi:hypothetical protein
MSMDLEVSAIFLRARDAVEAELGKHGFRLTEELFAHAAFGSAHAEYRHRTHWLRLTWDGKDRQLWLTGAVTHDPHVLPGPAQWRPLDESPPPGTPPRFLNDESAADARIAELLAQIDTFRKAKATV